MATKTREGGELLEFEETFVEDVWNDENYDYIRETHADTYVGHWFGQEGDLGVEGLVEFVRAVHDGFPDFRMEVDFMMADEEMSAVGFTNTGTHDGEFMGIPPTGRTGSTHGIMVHRFEDGKVVEAWAVWDALRQFQQLGVIPETFTLAAFLETGANLAKQDVLKLTK